MTIADQPASLNSGSTRTSGKIDSVLIAEDDSFFRHLLEGWLKQWNYRVVRGQRTGRLERFATGECPADCNPGLDNACGGWPGTLPSHTQRKQTGLSLCSAGYCQDQQERCCGGPGC